MTLLGTAKRTGSTEATAETRAMNFFFLGQLSTAILLSRPLFAGVRAAIHKNLCHQSFGNAFFSSFCL